jgi:large subunit ribosomal protein L10
MMLRSKKEEVVAKLRKDIENANAIFLTNLIGITSNDSVQLRKDIRKAGGKVLVTRNTLFRRAAEGTHCEAVLAKLKGPNAVALSFGDAPGVAKVLYEASKTLEAVQLKGGYLGSQELKAKDVRLKVISLQQKVI